MKKLLFTVVLAAALGAPAAAAQPTDAARAAARELAEQGGSLYQQKRYAEALEKLDKAYAILPVPTIGYWSARCMQEVGRWVEASERYLEVTRLALPKSGTDLHRRAQDDAAQAREALLPRISRLRIVLRGAAADEVAITLDGTPVAPAMLDVPMPADPGERHVLAVRGDEPVERRVVLEEGKVASVEIAFDPKKAPPPAPPSSPEPVPIEDVPPGGADSAAGEEGSGVEIAGYVALGLGGAALAAGIATGAVLLVKNQRLADRCLDGECSSREAGDVRVYSALRPATTVLLAGGGGIAAVGLVLVLTAPGEDPPATGVKPLIGPGWIGVRGRF